MARLIWGSGYTRCLVFERDDKYMRKFKTESKRLLDLMVNSIYTNKEIFLRELISNASDSLDKLYTKALIDGDNSINRDKLEISVSVDTDERTVTITDNGIGMTAEELEKNLGTIAHSGSLEFKEGDQAAEHADEIDIIGQFGVGFYSAFMVADKVTVVSKAYGSDEANVWESDGLEGYTIEPGERYDRGTDVILHIRPNGDSEDTDFDGYLTTYRLKSLIKRYSDYIRYPIRMNLEKRVEMPRPADAGDDYEPQYETRMERETINSMVPIWTRKKSDVTDEEYNEFYKATFHDNNDPLRVISLHAEGTINYDALLFIPKEAPFDLYSKDFKSGLALYSSNVMIMEQCEDLLPDAFRFVRGVVDSPDLNLNISREMLQHDRQLKAIERRIEKKVKAELVDLRDNARDDYVDFFGKFGHTFKYAIYTTYGMKGELLNDLLLFQSAKEGKPVTLDEYNEAAAEEQEFIYYATGDVAEKLAKAPSVRNVVDKGYDVLLCSDNVDEFALMSIGEYGEKSLKNVASGDLGLESDEDAEEAEKINTENVDMFTDMKNVLGEKVSAVVVSNNLSSDLACRVVADGPVSLGMEKYFSQLPDGGNAPEAHHILELNPEHTVFEKLQNAYKGDDIDTVERYAKILYGQALLAEGLDLPDPSDFNAAVLALMA